MSGAILVFDHVRSYDFDTRRDCYAEGVVVAIVTAGQPFVFTDPDHGTLTIRQGPDGCDRYAIRVTRRVVEGLAVGAEGVGRARFVFPPVNGTPGLFRDVCDDVERVEPEPEVRAALYRCAAPACPGLPWRASEQRHPCPAASPEVADVVAELTRVVDALAGS